MNFFLRNRFIQFFTGIFLVSFYFIFSYSFLLGSPPVWPDEALFASPARELAAGRGLGTPLLAGLLPGIAERTYTQPPVYFFFLGTAFKLFGDGLLTMRLFSLVCSLMVLFFFFRLAVNFFSDNMWAILATLLLAFDPLFIRGSHVGRMDVLAVLFALVALLFVQKAVTHRRPTDFLLAGIFLSLGIFTHLLIVGVLLAVLIFFCFLQGKKLRWSELGLFLLPLVLALLAYALYVFQDLTAFRAQFGGQVFRKAGRAIGVKTIWQMGQAIHLDLRSLPFVLLYFWGLGVLCLDAFKARFVGQRGLIVVVFAVMFVLAVPAGREMWYPVYTLPFAYLAFLELWRRGYSGEIRFLLFGLTVLMLAANLYLVREQLVSRRQNYDLMVSKISKFIPPKSKVFLDMVPDPTFGLWRQRPDLKLTQFIPPGSGNDLAYGSMVEKIDIFLFGNSKRSAIKPPIPIKEYLSRGHFVSIEGETSGNFFVLYYRSGRLKGAK